MLAASQSPANAGFDDIASRVGPCTNARRKFPSRSLQGYSDLQIGRRSLGTASKINPFFPQFHSQKSRFHLKIALTWIKQLFSLFGVDG